MKKILLFCIVSSLLFASCGRTASTDDTASAGISSSVSASVSSSSSSSSSQSSSAPSAAIPSSSSKAAAVSSKAVVPPSKPASQAASSKASSAAAVSSKAVTASSSPLVSSSKPVSSSSSAAVAPSSKAAVPQPVVSSSSSAAVSSSSSVSQVTNPVITGSRFLDDVESEVIDYINAERQSLGLSKLKYNQDLRSAARIRSRELVKVVIETNNEDMFRHKRPNGDEWYTVLQKDIVVNFQKTGENLALVKFNEPGATYHTDAQRWFEQWKNSDEHYKNMIRPEYTHIGLGIYYEQSNDYVYAVGTTLFTKM